MMVATFLRRLRPRHSDEKLLALGFGPCSSSLVLSLSARAWERYVFPGYYGPQAEAFLARAGSSAVRLGPPDGLARLVLVPWESRADLVALDVDAVNVPAAVRDPGHFTLILLAGERERAKEVAATLGVPVRLEEELAPGAWLLLASQRELSGPASPFQEDAATGHVLARRTASLVRGFIPRTGLWAESPAGPALRVSRNGAEPVTAEAQAWLRLLAAYPALDDLGGTSVAALACGPAAVRRGPAILEELERLGFKVDRTRERDFERAHASWRQESAALAVLSASEVLAYVPEGPVPVVATATLGDAALQEGETVSLQRSWLRAVQAVSPGREVKRALTVFRVFRCGMPVVEIPETDPAVTALLDALGSPAPPTVLAADAPVKARERLARLEALFATRGRELLPYQHQELLRLVQRRRVLLAWEQGTGKTVAAACWAAMHGASRVLVATPSYLVPVWLQELHSWGFQARELTRQAAEELRRTKGGSGQTTFWVASYEALKLTGRHVEWRCDHRELNEARRSRGRPELEPSVVRGRVCPQCHRRLTRRCPRCDAPNSVPVCRVCGHVTVHWRRRESRPAWACRHLRLSREMRRNGKEPPEPVTTAGASCPVCSEPAPDFQRWAQTAERAARLGLCPTTPRPQPVQYPLYRRVKDAFDCVILDEAQLAKSRNTLVGEAVRSLRAPLRMIVTGTPVRGYIPDIFYNLGWLLGWKTPQWPFAYRELRHFTATFAALEREAGEDGEFGEWKILPEVSNLTALWRLLAPWVSRFRKEEVLELPPKHQHVLTLSMPPEQAELYAQLQQRARAYLAGVLQDEGIDEHSRACLAVRALWPLRYAASCPASKHCRWQEMQPLPPGYRGAKTREALRLVEEIRRKGEKAVIFSSLKDLLQEVALALAAAGIPFLLVHGDMPARERAAAVQTFNRGRETVLLASTGALGHGVTVTAANHVILMNEEWSPEPTAQAQDRVHRIGQDREVHVYTLICQGTIDEDIHGLNTQKAALQAAVVDRIPASGEIEERLAGREDIRLVLARRLVARFRVKVHRRPPARQPAQPEPPETPGRPVQLRLF